MRVQELELTPIKDSGELAVLHVVSHLPPDRIGGVGEVVATVHRGLLEAGHRSRVLTTGTTADEQHIERICSTPDGFVVASGRHLAEAMSADIVHFHHGEALLLMQRLYRQQNRPRIILTLHVDAARIAKANTTVDGLRGRSGYVQSTLRDPMKRRLDARAMKLADATTFISHAGALEMSTAAGQRPPTVVHNGVGPVSNEGEVAPPVDLLFVGTAGPRKGIDLLPAVLRKVRMERPEASLRIVGFSMSAEPELQRSFEDAGCSDGVEWAGPVQNREVISHYRSAKMLIVPSRYEGLPMVILEAGSVGLPSVATDVGGTSEAVVHGQTGQLVAAPDPELLANGCLALLNDNELRKRSGDGIRALVADRFSIERQQAGYMQLYRELTD